MKMYENNLTSNQEIRILKKNLTNKIQTGHIIVSPASVSEFNRENPWYNMQADNTARKQKRNACLTCIIIIQNSGSYDFPTLWEEALQLLLGHRLG